MRCGGCFDIFFLHFFGAKSLGPKVLALWWCLSFRKANKPHDDVLRPGPGGVTTPEATRLYIDARLSENSGIFGLQHRTFRSHWQ